MADVVLVNAQDEILGKVPIQAAHKEGLWHRVSVVYLLNEKGEIILQERTDGAGFDHSCAGHVDPGENYFDAARRELEEELGVSGVELREIVKVPGDEPKPHIQSRYRHWFCVFECIANPVRLEPKEVRSVLLAKPQEVWQDMLKEHPLRKYCKGFQFTLEAWLKAKGML